MPQSQALQLGEKYGFVLSGPAGNLNRGSKAPLVVLAGWVGCKDRYLAKFSGFLNQAGYTTVRSICPTTAIFFPTTHLRRRWAAALLAFIDGVDPSRQRPLVFYAFSNGGAFPISIISRLAKEEGRHAHVKQRVLGVIFDSCPCYMHGSTGARALGEGQSLPVRALLGACFYVLMLIMLVTDPCAPQRFWAEMTNLRLGRKSLHLYSADDPLCDADKLDQLIEARREAGHAVAAHKWEASAHVAHYRLHPQQYKQLVLEFLEELRRG